MSKQEQKISGVEICSELVGVGGVWHTVVPAFPHRGCPQSPCLPAPRHLHPTQPGIIYPILANCVAFYLVSPPTLQLLFSSELLLKCGTQLNPDIRACRCLVHFLSLSSMIKDQKYERNCYGLAANNKRQG